MFVMAQCLAEAHRLSRWSMVLLLNEGMNMPLHLHRRSDQKPAPLFTGPGWARRLGRQREPRLPAFIPRLRRDSLFKRRHIPQINTCVFAARSPGALLNTQQRRPRALAAACNFQPAGYSFVTAFLLVFSKWLQCCYCKTLTAEERERRQERGGSDGEWSNFCRASLHTRWGRLPRGRGVGRK